MAGFDFQRFMAKTLLAMPGPVLRAMAGGGAFELGGRVLDPRFQFLMHAGRDAPGLANFPAEIARAGSAASLTAVAGPPEPGVRTEDFTMDGPGGPVPVRAYRPPVQDPQAPLMVFAHFGGGVIGDLETCHVFCGILAKGAHCAVLSVDYRLAPEHKFPAGLDDVLAAYRWARENTARFGAPEGRVAVGGDSMGGNFAAIVAQEMKRAGEPQPALQLLIYPAVDVASQTPSMNTYAQAYPLSRETMEWFMRHYLNPDDDPKDPRASPIHAADVAGLAPAVVVTAGFDPLVDQGEAYAKRLKEAGVPVAYRCYDALAHAFTAFTGAVPAADIACREIAGMVREGFEGRIR